MKNKLILSFISVVLFVSVFSVSASAENYGSYKVWWNEPELVDNAFYIELLLQNKNNSADRYVEAFYCYAQPMNSSFPVQIAANITSSQITIAPIFSGSDTDFSSFSIEHFRNTTLNVPRHTVSSQDETNSFSYPYSSYKVIAFHFWGTGSIDNTGFPQGAFSVDYGGWELQKIALLNDLKTSLSNVNSSTSSLLSNLKNLYNLFLPSKGKTDNFLYTIDNKLNLIERNTDTASGFLNSIYHDVSDLRTYFLNERDKTDSASSSFSSAGGSSVDNIASDTGGVSSSLSNSLSSGQSASDALNIFGNDDTFGFFSSKTYQNLDPSASSSTNSPSRVRSRSVPDGERIVDYLNPYFDSFDNGG